MVDKLEACPFCGGEAKLVSGTSSTVQCQNDQCIIGDPAPFNDFSHHADAIAAWNTRATPANGEQVERVAQAIFDAIDPTSGDPIGVLLHAHNPFINGNAPLADQIAEARTIAVAAAQAAIAAATLSTPTEDARERVKFLEEALERIAAGTTVSVGDGERCPAPLGAGLSQDIARTALGNKETDRHG